MATVVLACAGIAVAISDWAFAHQMMRRPKTSLGPGIAVVRAACVLAAFSIAIVALAAKDWFVARPAIAQTFAVLVAGVSLVILLCLKVGAVR